MADHIWISQGSTDYAVAANWSNGVVPGGVVGDSIIFRGSRSNVSVLENVDRSGDSTYSRVVTEPDYGGSVGATGSPLILTMIGDTNDRAIHRGYGTFTYQAPTSGDVVVDSQNTVDAARISGTPRDVCVKNGATVLSADSVSYVVVSGATASLDIQALNVNTGSGMLLVRGTIQNAVSLPSTTPLVIADTYIMTGKLGADCPVVILPTGTLIYKPATAPAAGDTPNVVINGILDLRESSFDLSARFKRVIIGRMGQIAGMPFGGIAPTQSFIDLRQEYP